MCNEGPHSRAMMVWSCQGVQMVTIGKDHPGVEAVTGVPCTLMLEFGQSRRL